MSGLKRLGVWLTRSLRRGGGEVGMATAEYAVGTVAVVSLGGVIVKLLSDPAFQAALWSFVQWLFNLIMGLVTGGK